MLETSWGLTRINLPRPGPKITIKNNDRKWALEYFIVSYLCSKIAEKYLEFIEDKV